jgi:hypothetical protein
MTASGTISSDTTWYGKVTVTGDVTVASGAELTIDPGSEIAFNSGKKITVNGDIDVNGLANALVIFTRSDTASTSRTYWYGIKISSTGGFDFDYFEMYGASYGIYPYYAVGSIRSPMVIFQKLPGHVSVLLRRYPNIQFLLYWYYMVSMRAIRMLCMLINRHLPAIPTGSLTIRLISRWA